MLCVPSEVLPFGSCAACRQRSISISQGGHDHLRRRHQQLFTGAVQRLGDQALLGRTHRRGAVQRLGAAQADRNPPAKARKSLSALGCKCTIRMRRAARSPKLRVCRGGGEGKGLLLAISFLAIAAPADWHLRGTAVLPLHCKYTERSDVSAIRNCRTLPAIAEPCNCRKPHCNCRGSAAIRVCKCTLQTPPAQRGTQCNLCGLISPLFLSLSLQLLAHTDASTPRTPLPVLLCSLVESDGSRVVLPMAQSTM